MSKTKYIYRIPVYSDKEILEECINNKCKKKKKKRHIKPIVKKCQQCGKRVKHHHYLCNKCWEKTHNPEKYKNIELESNIIAFENDKNNV